MDTESQDDIAAFHRARRRYLRRCLLVFVGVLVSTMFLTWCGRSVLFGVAKGQRAYEREREQWLEERGCVVTRHREEVWNYHFFLDYWEHIPGETCYRCAKGETFCENE